MSVCQCHIIFQSLPFAGIVYLHIINFVMIVEQIAHICILSPFNVFLGNLSHFAVLSAALSFISETHIRQTSRLFFNGDVNWSMVKIFKIALFKQINKNLTFVVPKTNYYYLSMYLTNILKYLKWRVGKRGFITWQLIFNSLFNFI